MPKLEKNNIKQRIPTAEEVIYGFPKRLSDAIIRVGGIGKLHKLTDIPIRTIQDWESGKTEPKISRIAQVALACEVSLNWLISGEGEMEYETSMQWGTTDVPKYEIKVSAGAGATIDFEEPVAYIPIPTMKLRRLDVQAKLAFLVDVSGDSMEPIIPNGATVLAERILEYNYILKGIYIFRIDNELFIKDLDRGTAHPGVVIRSANPEYETVLMNPAEANRSLEVIARVVLE